MEKFVAEVLIKEPEPLVTMRPEPSQRRDMKRIEKNADIYLPGTLLSPLCRNPGTKRRASRNFVGVKKTPFTNHTSSEAWKSRDQRDISELQNHAS